MSKILYIFDLDSTLADASARSLLAGPEPDKSHRKRYMRWLKKIQNKKSLMHDKPVPGMVSLVKKLKKNAIYLTSRQESYRDVTQAWLNKHGFPKLKLYMRSRGDWSRAGMFKESVILSLVKDKKINVIIWDDDKKECLFQACQRQGWVLCKVVGY